MIHPTKSGNYLLVWLFIGGFLSGSYWLLGNSASWQTLDRKPWIAVASAAGPQVLGVSTINAPEGWQKITPESYLALITETTAQQTLTRRGVVTDPADYIRGYPDLKLGVGGTVYVYRAPAVTVIDWGKSRTVRSWLTTVGAILTEAGIDIGDQDKVEPEVGTQTGPGGDPLTITIVRVQEADVHVTEPISFSTQKQTDSNLEKGKLQVVQKGKNGVRTKTYRVRREDGVEVSRVLSNTEVTTVPIPEIIKEGTKVVVYGTGSATWYTKSLNHVAAHNTLPKGTRVRVVNTANGKSTVVTVVGGGLRGALIDLSYDAFSDIGDPGAGRLSVRVEKIYE